MESQRTVELIVGFFLLAAILALMMLAFKVSGLTNFFNSGGYKVTAQFDDIGQLKVRAPIKMGGVAIGEVTNIRLDPQTFKAVVTMRIRSSVKDIPTDSSASIMTSGLLGDNYIALSPMYATNYLRDGSVIEETHSALILEKLIGQLIFKVSNTPTGDKK